MAEMPGSKSDGNMAEELRWVAQAPSRAGDRLANVWELHSRSGRAAILAAAAIGKTDSLGQDKLAQLLELLSTRLEALPSKYTFAFCRRVAIAAIARQTMALGATPWTPRCAIL